MNGREWTKAEIKKLGTNTDEIVSKKIGRTKEAVRAKRTELEIAPFVLPKFVPTSAQKRLLGKHTDKSLAEMWGVTRVTVCKARLALRIKCFGATSHKN